MKSREDSGAGSAGHRNAAAGEPIPGLGAIIMAAGLGKRMRSKLAKVLHAVGGRPMVWYAVDLAERLADRGVGVVVGHQAEQVKAVIQRRAKDLQTERPIHLIEQSNQLGTGHAVMQARAVFTQGHREPPSAYLILNGDTPLLTEETVRELWKVHQAEQATVTLLTATMDAPTDYGRVVRSGATNRTAAGTAAASVERIVEERDATHSEAQIREINVGTYVVDGQFLFEALDKLQPKNAQQEYYLTDLIGIAAERGRVISAVTLEDTREGLGINSRKELAVAQEVLRQRICAYWMEAGVTLHDPSTTWIDADVTIGQDTVVYPHVALEGTTRIGEDCTVRSHVRLSDCVIGDRVQILDCCVLREAKLEEDSVVGPFTHLRPGSIVRRKAKVGNFVEMKKTVLGEGSKASHLTYLGDTRVGRRVNVGAGTVTCNYDGRNKYETVIEDDAFVGSDAILVAPVKVGRGSLVAAGTTVTNDIPEDALAIARPPQINRAGWAARRRALPEGGTAKALSATVGRPARPSGSKRRSAAKVKRKNKK